MKTKSKSIIICILILGLLVSGCGPGQVFGPTITPSPTITAKSTPTFTPTSSSTITLTPMPTNTPTLTPTLTPTPRIPLSGENIKQWQIIQTLGGVSGVVIAFTPDGKLLAIAEQNRIVFYDISSLQIQNTIITNNPVIGLLINQDGNVLLAMDHSKNVQRYQLPSGEPMGNSTPLKNVKIFVPKAICYLILRALGRFEPVLFTGSGGKFSIRSFVEGLITMAFTADATLAALGGKDGFELFSLDWMGGEAKPNGSHQKGIFLGPLQLFPGWSDGCPR